MDSLTISDTVKVCVGMQQLSESIPRDVLEWCSPVLADVLRTDPEVAQIDLARCDPLTYSEAVARALLCVLTSAAKSKSFGAAAGKWASLTPSDQVALFRLLDQWAVEDAMRAIEERMMSRLHVRRISPQELLTLYEDHPRIVRLVARVAEEALVKSTNMSGPVLSPKEVVSRLKADPWFVVLSKHNENEDTFGMMQVFVRVDSFIRKNKIYKCTHDNDVLRWGRVYWKKGFCEYDDEYIVLEVKIYSESHKVIINFQTWALDGFNESYDEDDEYDDFLNQVISIRPGGLAKFISSEHLFYDDAAGDRGIADLVVDSKGQAVTWKNKDILDEYIKTKKAQVDASW